MGRIALRAASQGTGGQAKDVGEIDDTGLSWGDGRGRLSGAGAGQLLALLGQGYMERRFELLFGTQGLGGCEITKEGPVLEFTYAATFLADEPSR
jgi:hypothetical protein